MNINTFVDQLTNLARECGNVEVVIDDGMTKHLSVVERAESAICTQNGGERRIVISVVRRNEEAGLKVKGFADGGATW
jgi:hypothetical protein